MTISTPDNIHDQAADWVIRADSDQMSQSEKEALAIWLRQSPDHVAAFLKASELFGVVTPDILESYSLEAETASNVTLIESAGDKRWTSRVLAGVTALAASLLVGFVVLEMSSPSQAPDLIVTAQTEAKEIETLTLVDGSQVHLNTATSLTATYSSDARTVELSAGDAIFEVESDPDKPFSVHAGAFQATALGTTFSVSKLDDAVRLSVLEGQVAFALLGGDAPQTIIAAGESAQWRNGEATPIALSIPDIGSQMAWKDRELQFNNTSLVDIVTAFNRYNDVKLVILDQELAEAKVSGRYDLNDIDSFLSFLQLTRQVSIERTATDITISQD